MKYNCLLLLIIIVSIIGSSVSQILRGSNHAISFNRNDRSESRSMTLSFNLESGSSSSVTLFIGNTFAIKFPSESLTPLSPSLSCLININNTVAVKITSTVARNEDTIFCQISGAFQNGVRVERNVSIVIGGINFNYNYHGWLSIGLYSSQTNGILLFKDNAFLSFGLNTKFWEANNSFVSVIDVGIVNTTANECELINGICKDLFPWSAYTLTFTVSVSKYFDEREIDLCFRINGVSGGSSVKITSQSNGDGILNSALSSSNADGSFGSVSTSTFISPSGLCLTGINRFINPTEQNKIFQFFRGTTDTSKRTFKLSFSGYNTLKLSNGASAFGSIETFLLWKNTNTILSYHTFTSSTSFLIKNYSFTNATANTKNSEITNSVSNNEDSSDLPHKIYENGYYHLRFSIRIPKVNDAATLVINHLSKNYSNDELSQVKLNFITSTCDFSSETNQNNVIGQRFICSPENSNNLQSGGKDSQIRINLPESPNAIRDVIFTVWAYAIECPKKDDKNQFLMFEYSYGNFVQSKFTSKIECVETIDHQISYFSPPARNLEVTKYSLLYQELYNWNIFQFKYAKESTNDNFNNLVLQGENIAYDSIKNTSYSTGLGNNLSILAKVENNGQNLPLPYLNEMTLLIEGNFKLSPSIFHSFPTVAPEKCSFSWFTQGEYKVINHFNQDHSNSLSRITVEKNSITSFETVNAPGKREFLNIYDKLITNIGFATDCYNIKPYSDSIKNIFSSMSVNISYSTKIDNVVYEIRRIRFFKMFNGELGFRSTADLLVVKNTALEFHGVFHSSYNKENICLLELKPEFFNTYLDTIHNTLMMGLLDNEILNVGDNIGDFYPISNAHLDSVTAYPLYSQILPTPNETRQNTLFTPYIVINNFSNKLVSKASNTSSLFIPLPCGNRNSRISFQMFSLGTDVNKQNNQKSNTISITTLDNGAVSTKITLRNRRPSEDPLNVNTIYLTNENVKSFKTLFILTTLDLSTTSNPSIFSINSNILSLHKSVKFGSTTFTRGFFLKSLNNSYIEIPLNSQITYFNRSDSTRTLRIHGLGQTKTTVDQNVTVSNYHFTNSEIEVLENIPILAPNTNLNSLILEVTQLGITYKNDNAANIVIVAKIFSSFATTSGILTLNSTAFLLNHSLCVRTDTPTSLCVVKESSLTCSNISLTAKETINFSISCFNLKLNAEGEIVFLSSSNIFYNSSLTRDMTYENAKLTFPTVEPKELASLKPNIARLCGYSSNFSGQLNSYGIVDIVVELGRNYRLGQTLTLNANLDSLYIEPARIPLCIFFLKNNYSCSRSEFYDDVDHSQFIGSCKVSGSGAAHTIELNTQQYVTKTNFEYPSQFIIRLYPVILKNINNIPYTIITNIRGNQIPIVLANNDVTNFPLFTPPLSSDIPIEIQTTPGLCNVKNIEPRIIAANGLITFNFNLSKITERLAVVNTGQTISRAANGFMIFLHPDIYAYSPNIVCFLLLEQVPCDMNLNNFVYIRIGRSLTNGEYDVSLQNIRIPSIVTQSSPINNLAFLCSVNFYDNVNNLRDSIRNGFGSSLSTFNVNSSGNFLDVIPSGSILSSNLPRGLTNITLRFILDFTDGFTSVKFTAPEGRNPVLYILFQREFVGINSTLTGVTATLEAFVRNFSTEENNITTTVVKSTVEFPSTVTPIFRGIKLTFTAKEVQIPDNLDYFELKLNNIPTPETSGVFKLPEIIMYNEDITPNYMIKKHENFRNRTGPFSGLTFDFNTIGRALIEPVLSNTNILPGRFYRVNFTLTSQRVYFSTKITLSAGTVFKSLDNSTTLINTGPDRNTSFMFIGTNCDALYGSYFLNFTVDNTNVIRMSPLRINLMERNNSNRESITITSTLNSSNDESLFDIPNAGFLNVYLYTKLQPVENVTISLTVPKDTVNETVFTLQSPPNSANIQAGRLSSYFTYQLSEKIINPQKININISNKCYALGSLKTDIRMLTFSPNSSLISKLENFVISDRFKYVLNSANEPVNQLKFKYDALENTQTVLALICKSSDVPTREQAILGRGNTLAKYRTIFNSKNSTIDIVFDNLERRNSFKLAVWVSNYAVNNTVVNYLFENVPLITNSSILSSLETPNISRPEHLRFRFTQVQNNLTYSRIQETLQNIFSFNEGFVVRGQNRSILPGFNLTEITSCNTTSATNEFLQVKSTLRLRNMRNKSTLRFRNLQTSNTTNTTINFIEVMYYSVFQNSNSRNNSNLESLVSSFYKDIETVSRRTEIFGNLGIEGNWETSRDVDTPFNSTLFRFNNLAYNNNTGVITLTAIADRRITCDWRLLNDVSSGSNTLLSAQEITTCVKSTTITNVSCGKMLFDIEKDAVPINVQTGVLGTGKYFINVLCSSPIPSSSNSVIFRSPQVAVIDLPIEEPIIPISDDEDDNNKNDFVNLIFINKFLLLILIILIIEQ